MFKIKSLDTSIQNNLRQKIDQKTKPVGALGKLEEIAIKLGLIQQSIHPTIMKPEIILFAGDHGLAQEGISPYPQEVTVEMVRNFHRGGAAINVFARQHEIGLSIVDCGILHDLKLHDVINARIANKTKNSLQEAAMSKGQALTCIENGIKIVEGKFKTGCNMIGFGEMGIGNSSAAALISAKLCNVSIESTVGPGTGCDRDQLSQKTRILAKVLETHTGVTTPIDIMAAFAGFEMMTALGSMLRAAELGMTVLIDGYIMSSVALAACKWFPEAQDYMIFCHSSASPGHRIILHELQASPILDLEMRLGEGTGVAVAYPIIQSACRFLVEMASFGEAEVSQKK